MEIRTLKLDDVSEDYVSWFNDKDVIRYSDNQYKVFSLDGQRDYVKNCLNDKNILLFGIFVDNKHIGNIILNGIISVHKRAEVSYVIGNKYYWGKGIGKSAVAKVISLAKNDLKLNKLFAGVAKNNFVSRKILENNGFILEGIRKNHLFYNKIFEDQYDYGLVF